VILQSNKNQAPGSSVQDLTTNYYTFKIISCDSFDEYVFSPFNFSQSPYYDAFTVSIGTVSSPTGSVVLNADTGQYNFYVYKMPNEYNLNIGSASYQTEAGILQIMDPNTFNWEGGNVGISFTQSDADTIKVFTEL
jgi:hypothetical protein